MLELLTEISIEKRFYNCCIVDHTKYKILMMMILVSKLLTVY